MAGTTFGWDLLYRSVESEIKSNEDLLLCFTHFVLISNNFKCIGIGESKTVDGTEREFETLPKAWNDVYALRYKHMGRLYNLKCTKLDDGVIINLLRIDERNVSLVQLNSRSIAARNGRLNEMFPNYKEMIDLVKNQLIDKVIISKKSKEVSSQTESTPAPSSSTTTRRENPQSDFIPPPPPLRSFAETGVGVGEYDLYPLGRNPLIPPRGIGGGGMLFEPPRVPNFPGGPNMGVPPGSIPPGARFDPFRPPEADRFPRRRNNPDNDEFPPPGYDDMFM